MKLKGNVISQDSITKESWDLQFKLTNLNKPSIFGVYKNKNLDIFVVSFHSDLSVIYIPFMYKNKLVKI